LFKKKGATGWIKNNMLMTKLGQVTESEKPRESNSYHGESLEVIQGHIWGKTFGKKGMYVRRKDRGLSDDRARF
jgi:hypothetical protein